MLFTLAVYRVGTLPICMDGWPWHTHSGLGAEKYIINYTGNTEINTPGTIIMQVLLKYIVWYSYVAVRIYTRGCTYDYYSGHTCISLGAFAISHTRRDTSSFHDQDSTLFFMGETNSFTRLWKGLDESIPTSSIFAVRLPQLHVCNCSLNTCMYRSNACG